MQQKIKDKESNPFDNHFKSKRAKKDAEERQGLVQEFWNRGRESNFVDKRIAERAKNMTEDEKMRLRFLKEARENSGFNRGKSKFHLDDEDEDQVDFFTHKGKKLEELDDYKDEISHSDDDLAHANTREEREAAKGILN